ncbi:MAG: tetratricopeptide repeat protein [Deltaproteobacteria bacterium]|nr:tetratricopeptide repeat protein [Deltaproteobacteria bacterium]
MTGRPDRRKIDLAIAAITLAALVVSGSRPATAQGNDMARAKETFAQGQALFDNGDYAAARNAFQASLAAFPHFRTIFNIALCEEKLDNVAAAVAMYRRYVDWPAEVPNRDEVRRKMDELAALLPPEPKPAGPNPRTEPPRPARRPPPGPEPGPDLRVPGWISVGVGGAAVVAGGVLLGLAKSKSMDMKDATGTAYDPSKHDSLPVDGKTYETAGWVTAGVGVAALAAGVIMLVVSGPGEDAQGAVSARVAPGAGGASLLVAF